MFSPPIQAQEPAQTSPQMAYSSTQVILVAAMAATLWAAGASAQSSSCSSVIMNLSPCLDYITGNTSTPSSSCCSQLSSVVKSDPQCICTIISTGASSASSLGITVNQTQVLALPTKCNVEVPLSQCNFNGPTASPATPSTPSSGGSGTKSTGTDSSDGSTAEVNLPIFLMSLFAVGMYTLTSVSPF